MGLPLHHDKNDASSSGGGVCKDDCFVSVGNGDTTTTNDGCGCTACRKDEDKADGVVVVDDDATVTTSGVCAVVTMAKIAAHKDTQP